MKRGEEQRLFLTPATQILSLHPPFLGRASSTRSSRPTRELPATKRPTSDQGFAAEEPGARGVEWLSYSDRIEERAMPLPRSLAHLKREISEKKWAEARQWAGGRTCKTKHRMPKSQTPDGMVAWSNKRLASRFYQAKTWHCLTGQYLHWTKNRTTPQCWWRRYQIQTREHLFRVCLEWKGQQKILWAEVWKEIGKWKSRWKIRNPLADGRCNQAVLGFLSATDVGRRVPVEEVAESVSEWELRQRRELEEERRVEAEEQCAAGELGAGEELPLFLSATSFMASADED